MPQVHTTQANLLTPLMHFLCQLWLHTSNGIAFQLGSPFLQELNIRKLCWWVTPIHTIPMFYMQEEVWDLWSSTLIDQIWLCSPFLLLLLQKTNCRTTSERATHHTSRLSCCHWPWTACSIGQFQLPLPQQPSHHQGQLSQESRMIDSEVPSFGSHVTRCTRIYQPLIFGYFIRHGERSPTVAVRFNFVFSNLCSVLCLLFSLWTKPLNVSNVITGPSTLGCLCFWAPTSAEGFGLRFLSFELSMTMD